MKRSVVNIFVLLFFSYGLIAQDLYVDSPIMLDSSSPKYHFYDLKFLDEHGKVKERYFPQERMNHSDKLIVLILDAHANPKTQKNISEIIKGFVDNYEIDLIGVEGAEGELYLDVLKKVKEEKKGLAQELLDKCLLTGVELWGLNQSNSNFSLFGVEDKDLYLKNFVHLIDVYSEQKRVGKFCDTYKDLISQAKKEVYTSSALKEFDEVYTEFSSKKMKRLAYIKYLMSKKSTLLSHIKNFEAKFPNIQSMFEATKKEGSVNFDEINSQVEKILQYKEKLPKDVASRLAQLSSKGKKVQLSLEWVELLKRCQESLKDESLKSLDGYIEYVKMVRGIRTDSLKAELWHLSFNILNQFAENDDERTLIRNSQICTLSEMISGLSLTKGHYHYMKEEGLLDGFHALVKRLAEKADDLSLRGGETLVEEIPLIQMVFKSADQYYYYLHRRDGVMLNNLLEKMDSTGEKKSILITGGFHYGGIAHLMRKKNIPYIAIFPKVGPATDMYKKIMLDLKKPIESALNKA